MRLLPAALLLMAFAIPAISADDKPPAPDVDHPLPVCATAKKPKQAPCATPPRVVNVQDPDYPEQARMARVQGTVKLKIVVDTEGNVARAKVVKGLRSDLDEKALEAVKQWKFKAGTYEGKPVPVESSVEVSFRLR